MAYAFRDQHGEWHGEPDRLDDFTEVPLSIPQDANARGFAGQTITLRVGLISGQPNPFEGDISVSHTLVTGPGGRQFPVLFTHQVANLLTGPPAK